MITKEFLTEFLKPAISSKVFKIKMTWVGYEGYGEGTCTKENVVTFDTLEEVVVYLNTLDSKQYTEITLEEIDNKKVYLKETIVFKKEKNIFKEEN